MLDPNESLAFLRLVQAQRKTTKQSLQLATLYAAQALLSAALLLYGYHLAHARSHAVTWAIISAVLVLQPGIEQSITASAVRIAANLVGGLIGLAVGQLLGTDYPQLLLALLITVFASEFLRLDLGLRTACVASIIVMTSFDPTGGNVASSAVERLSAVLIGCLVAVAVQLLAERLRRRLGWTYPTALSSAPAKTTSPHSQE